MNSARYFVLFHARTVAYMLVAAVFGFGLWHQEQSDNAKIVASQINACSRGNVMRTAVNTDTRIIRYFMGEIAAATARRPNEESKQRALIYQAFAKALVNVPIPDCSKVVYHP